MAVICMAVMPLYFLGSHSHSSKLFFVNEQVQSTKRNCVPLIALSHPLLKYKVGEKGEKVHIPKE